MQFTCIAIQAMYSRRKNRYPLVFLSFAVLPRHVASSNSSRCLLQHSQNVDVVGNQTFDTAPTLESVPLFTHTKDLREEKGVSADHGEHTQPTGHAEHADHGSNAPHHSIFELPFTTVDTTFFWVIFAAMLVFTILVDRIQWYSALKASHSKAGQMFLNRVNSELMMFGCVGLLLFLLENTIGSMSREQSHLVEFVDILCSLGACNLIAIASMLFCTRKLSKQRWETMENEMKSSSTTGNVQGVPKVKIQQKAPTDYQLMASHFKRIHQAPALEYYAYLDVCLTRTSCDIMDIDWSLWLFMLVVVTVFLTYTLVRYSQPSTTSYLLFFVIANFMSLCSYAFVTCSTYFMRASLVRELQLSEEAQRGARGSSEPEVGRGRGKWIHWLKKCMQAVSLVNSFLLSLHLMLVQYNIRSNGYTCWWNVALLFPLLVSLFICLPVMVTQYTLVAAFCSPDSEALDIVISAGRQGEEDLSYLRGRWRERGRPQLEFKGSNVDEAGLQEVLQGLGLHASHERIHRLFNALDADENGKIDPSELMDALKSEST